MDALKVMAERENICNYIDIPLQHGSTRMLQLMRRGITREKTEQLLQTIREKVPGIAIRTTMIAGHPGETEQDFNELLRICREIPLRKNGSFHLFTRREYTFLYMPDDVPAEVKQERLEELMELQQGISFDLNTQKVGKTFKVLIDRKEGGNYVGRTESDSPEVDNEVIIDSPEQYLRIGDFVDVKINSATEFDLTGNVEQ